jgi:hypothetical protein
MLKDITLAFEPREPSIKNFNRPANGIPLLRCMLEGGGDYAEPTQCYHKEMDISLVEGVDPKWMEGLVLRTRLGDSIVLQRHRPHPLVNQRLCALYNCGFAEV